MDLVSVYGILHDTINIVVLLGIVLDPSILPLYIVSRGDFTHITHACGSGLNCGSQIHNDHIVASGTYKCDFIWKKGLCECNYIKDFVMDY